MNMSEEAANATAANAVNDFTFDVYRELRGSKGNLFFSPYSISSALAMTWAGAGGETALEMARALRFDNAGAESLHAGMKELRERFNSMPEDSGTLAVANRLWLDESENLLPDYAAMVESNYGAGAERVDFMFETEKARETINHWVEQITRDKIKDLLRPGNLSPITRLVLTNAIYFNSVWDKPFKKSNTKEKPFFTGKGKQKDVLMMYQDEYFLYGEEPGLQWVKLPYKIRGFSLMIFLPRENESFTQLEELEDKLTSGAYSAWAAGMQRRKVMLHMPKFKNEGRYMLKEILMKLGMKLAFTEAADFSGMTEGLVRIDSVIHQTFIELNEEKTEAAATAVGMVMAGSAIRMPEPPPVEFRADHPFVYFLTDDVTGVILFMGRMTSP